MSNTDSVNQKASPDESLLQNAQDAVQKTPRSKMSNILNPVEAKSLNPANESSREKLLYPRATESKHDYWASNTFLLQATGLIISIIWLMGAALYVQRTIGWNNISTFRPHELGGFLAGILAPIALFWMIAAFILRSNDVKMYAEALRGEIQAMIFPSEEADRRVNNDIERLIRQTAEVSRASRIVLNTINAAREGLKYQVTVLNDTSDQTIMRLDRLGTTISNRANDVHSVGEKLEETIQNIAEGTKATTEWMDKLKIANEQITDQTAMIDKSTQNTEQSVDRLSEMLRTRLEEMVSQRERIRLESTEMETRAKNVADALQKGTVKLYEFTDDALDKAKLIETRLQGHAGSIEHMIGLSVGNITAIEEQTLDAERRLTRVNAMVTDNALKLENVLQDAIDRMSTETQDAQEKLHQAISSNADDYAGRARNAVTETQDILFRATERMVGDFESARTGALDANERMQQAIADSSSRLIERSQIVLQQTQEALAGTGDKIAASVSAMGQQTRGMTTELQQAITDKASELVERAQMAVSMARDNLTHATDKVIGDIDQVSGRAKTVSDDILHEVTRKVADTSAAFAFIQQQIQTLINLFDERKSHLDEAGTSARATADSLQQSLVTVLDKVRETTGALQDSVTYIGTSVQTPINMLETAIGNAYGKANEMGGLIQTRADTLTHAADRISAHVTAMHDQLHTKGQDVALMAGKIAGHLQTVSQELEVQNEALATKTTGSIKSLEQLAALHNSLLGNIDKVATQTQTAQLQIHALQQTHVGLTDEAAKAQAQLGQVAERLDVISGETVGRIRSTVENMTALEADYNRLGHAGVENIDRVGQAYRDTLAHVQTDSENSNRNFTEMQQRLHEQSAESARTIEEGIDRISERIEALRHSAQAINETSDETVARITRVQGLNATVETGLKQLHEAADIFEGKIMQGGEVVTSHIASLEDSARRVENMTSHAVDTLIAQSQSLEQQTESQLVHLERSFDHAGSFTNRLRDYMKQLQADSQGVEDRLTQSIAALLAQGHHIDSSTERMIEKIAVAQGDLVRQTGDVQVMGDNVLARLQRATQHIADKATALEDAARMAQKQAEELRLQENKLKRDMFLSSTKFVVESLHSLALDFTRLLDGELSEKTWKSYQKGDTGSFARRLLHVRDDETQGRIKAKFAEDHEFRTYVQRYLRQFEEVYDQAAANDHADLLTTVFSTSDVGKLYKFLCSVLDRDARGSESAKLAA